MAERPKILIVDDDLLVIESAREILEGAGYVVSARSQALGTSVFLLQDRPDIVLLDVEMPALSGEALAAVIAAHSELRHVAIVFHSARRQAVLEDLVRRTGAIGAIQKTSDPRSFLAQLDSLVKRHRQRLSQA